jgi:prepilin-type N-terminal cleavage/methylation domain-containing protein
MKTNISSSRNRNGFTLVELLVVITIIITIAAIGFTMVSKMRKNADAAKQTSILGIKHGGVSVTIKNTFRAEW